MLLTTTELHQLLKLPALIAHYIEHLQHEELGIAEFLHEHYCHEHHHCNHESESEHELPFQCSDCTHFMISGIVIGTENFSLPVFETEMKHGVVRSEHFISAAHTDIWQPPKI